MISYLEAHEQNNHDLGLAHIRDRAERRAAIKARLKEIAAVEAEHADVLAIVANLRGEIEGATAEHQTATEPLQARWREAADIQSKIDVRVEIDAANTALEEKCAALNKRLSAAEAEAGILRMRTTSKQMLQNMLTNTASQGLIDRSRLLGSVEACYVWGIQNTQQMLERCEANLRAARENVAIDRRAVTPQLLEVEERKRQYLLGIAALTTLRAQTQAEAAALYQEMIAE